MLTRRRLVSAGHERSALLLPTPDPSYLLLVLHGTAQSANRFRLFSGRCFDRLAAGSPGRGPLVVYPEAYRGDLWNDARRFTPAAARRDGVDDVEFCHDLVEDLRAHVVPDSRDLPVAAVGYSNGAQLVVRLIHEAPDLLTAAGVIAAAQPTPEHFIAADAAEPVPLLLISGTADPLVPFAGGAAAATADFGLAPRGDVLSGVATARYFAARNGLPAVPRSRRLTASGSTSVDRHDFRAPGRAPLRWFVVHGGGHTVPNLTHDAPASVGATNHDIDAATEFDRFVCEVVQGSA